MNTQPSLFTPLFVGERLVLTPIDPDNDAPVFSRWAHDASYMRMLKIEPMQPDSPFGMKKKFEALEKEAEESKNLFYFHIRTKPTENGTGQKLIGFTRLYWIEWTNRDARIELGFGEPEYRGRGYGTEALRLMLHFAFLELNLHRLTAQVPEYNLAALHLFEKAGFTREVRRREALQRDGQRWDLFLLGLLRDEWQQAWTEA